MRCDFLIVHISIGHFRCAANGCFFIVEHPPLVIKSFMSNPLTAYQIIVGARNDAPNRTVTSSQVEILNKVLRSPNYKFTGYTITEGTGYWTPDPSGKAPGFWEKSSIITIFIDEKTQGRLFDGLVKELINALNQACVSVVKLGTAAIWYSSPTTGGVVTY